MNGAVRPSAAGTGHPSDRAGTRQGILFLRRDSAKGGEEVKEQAFYRERLEAQGIEVLIPDAKQRERVHTVIYDELCRGEIRADSRAEYLEIVASLAGQGAQGVILGCTEIGLLIQADDTDVPLFDTTAIHAEQAVEAALGTPES
ncbi:aspartate/glutamate racemase family protein [Halomonas alkalicola]|uniref:aspartate/glutamate racemase family protein n=1 Tax=Halomonas alkalicola TaxID=1930622 RepID=UPI00345B74A6